MTVKQYTYESEDSTVHQIKVIWDIDSLITLDGNIILAFGWEIVMSRLPEGIKLNMPDGSTFEFINRTPTSLDHLQILRNGKPINGSANITSSNYAGEKKTLSQNTTRRKIAYNPNITSDQLQQALSATKSDESSQFVNNELIEKEKAKAQKANNFFFIGAALFSLVAIAFGLFVHPIFCLAIPFLIALPFFFVWNRRRIGSPLKSSSLVEVVKEFYGNVLGQEIISLPTRVYQVIAPTSKDRPGCESVSSFEGVWKKCLQEISKNLVPNSTEEFLSFSNTSYIVTYKSENFFDVEYSGLVGVKELQYTIKEKYRALCHFEFHNVAVKLLDKWYLIAGEPGEAVYGNKEVKDVTNEIRKNTEAGLLSCPTCGLPFKTESGLQEHITKWH